MELVLTHKDGTTLNLNSRARCTAVTSAKQSKTLLSADTITIEVTAASPLDLRIGDTLLAFGDTYTLNRLPSCKKGGADVYKYTIELEGLQYALIDRLFMLPDGTVGDDLMCDLRGAVKILFDNANRDNSGKPYQLGGSPAETDYRNINYAGYNCLRALQQICEDWEVEFKMRETEAAIIVDLDTFTTTFPVAFSVGRSGGMYELTRNRPTDDLVTRLYAFGGTENLAYYRHTRLCLPGVGRKESYIEDESVSSVFGVKEGVYNFDDIYPKRTGRVTALGSDYKTFVDMTIDFDLNEKWATTDEACTEWLALKGIEDTADNRNVYFNDVAGKSTRWLMAGQTAQVHFQTGALAGYDIDIESYNHATHSLKLIPLTDANGYEFPSGTSGAFRIAVGDEYIFIGINLPDSYKTAAEQKLLTAAQERYDTMCRPRASYTLTLSPLWLQRVAGQGATGYNVFDVGDSVHVKDDALGLDTYIRVQAFERDCVNPYDYKLTIADDCTVQTAAKVMSEVKRLTAVVEAAGVADPNRKRRAWLTAQEVLNKTFDSEGHYYSEKIAPLSIETTMLAVGARSQQLALSNILFTPNAYNGTTADPSKLTATAGALLHYSIDPDGVKVWQMAALNVTGLASGALYVYAKCQREGTGGVFIVDAVQRVFDSDSSFYFFLIGTLSSVDTQTNTRALSLTYGSTTINGRFVKTGRISSNDGATYFDLDEGVISGRISFRNSSGGSSDVSTALNDIGATAAAAKSTADSAASAANAAKSTASNAASSATSALNTASAAASTASAAKSTADTALNTAESINVGARNYLYDTATARRVTGGGASASSNLITAYLYYGETSGEAWTAGTVVTFSCDYDASAMTGGTCPLLVHTTWWNLQTIKPGTSGHISVTMQLSNDITTRHKVYVQGKWDGEVGISKAKWEVGNKATSWTEAPEDVNARVSAAQSTATSAASAASAAQSTATSAASAASAAQSTADEAARRAAAALSGNMWVDQFFDAAYSNIYTGTETVPIGRAVIHSVRDIVFNDWVSLQPGHYYRIECTAKRTAGSKALYAGAYTNGHRSWTMEAISTVGDGWLRMAVTFAAGSLEAWGSYRAGKLYFFIPQASSGGDTTWLISNVTWQDVTAAVSNYLTECFKNNGTTDIEGGVVLTNFLGVRPLNGTFAVAGIVASDPVYNAGEVAFFAGATKAGGWSSAPFKVTYGGHVTLNDVEITSGGGMTLKDGKMTLSNGGLLSSFSNEKYTNLLDSLVGQSYTLNSPPVTESGGGGVPLTLGTNVSYDVTKWVDCNIQVGHSLNLPSNGTLKSTAPGWRAEYSLEYDNGVWPLHNFTLVFHLSTARTVPGNTSATGSAEKDITVTNTTPNTWTTITKGTFDACNDIAVSAGTLTDFRTLTLKSGTFLTTNNTGTIGTLPLLVIKVRLVKDAGTLSLKSTTYTNKYFSNGMMQARDANHYFGFLCGSGNGADLLLRQGNMGFRSSLYKGLLLMSFNAPHLSGSKPGLFKMNPISLVLRLTFNGSSSEPGYSAALLYDPYNYHAGAAPAVTRNGVGLVTFPHKLGVTSFTVLGSGVGTVQSYITIVSRTTSTVQLGISDDSSRNDYNVELVFIDYTILH